MTTPSPTTPPVTASSDDYTYDLHVDVPLAQSLSALTDDTAITQWWTSATRSERHGDDVRLFMGNGDTLVDFTVEHPVGTDDVAWNVTACVLSDWIGTKPTFSVRRNDEGSCDIEFRHVGLGPALECYDQCRAGWDHFMPSLNQFLETGEGRSNEPRDRSAS